MSCEGLDERRLNHSHLVDISPPERSCWLRPDTPVHHDDAPYLIFLCNVGDGIGYNVDLIHKDIS